MPRIRLDQAAVVASAERLTASQGSYTPRQLYYAACASAEAPMLAVSQGEIGAGVLLILVGVNVALIFHAPPAVTAGLLLAGGLLVALGLRMRAIEAIRRQSRALVVGYDEFQARVLPEVREQAPTQLVGMMDADSWPTAAPVSAPVAVVCDSRENAAMVTVLLHGAEVEAQVTTADALGSSALRLLVVHDCSPRGCAVGAELTRPDGPAVVDLGVRPRDVVGRALQVIEGAPARMPRDLGGALLPEELDWLLGGRRLDLAAFPADELVGRIRHALSGASDDEPKL